MRRKTLNVSVLATFIAVCLMAVRPAGAVDVVTGLWNQFADVKVAISDLGEAVNSLEEGTVDERDFVLRMEQAFLEGRDPDQIAAQLYLARQRVDNLAKGLNVCTFDAAVIHNDLTKLMQEAIRIRDRDLMTAIGFSSAFVADCELRMGSCQDKLQGVDDAITDLLRELFEFYP